MLHELPITNIRLLACHEDWHRMTPTEQGRHCAACNREVVDFTQASAAELVQARIESADGRVCGRFRPNQLTSGRPVRFGLWARAFALAAALVFGQGLTAREAWAQTRKATTTNATTRRPAARPTRRPKPVPLAGVPDMEIQVIGISIDLPEPMLEPEPSPAQEASRIYDYTEQMPQPPGGPEGLREYLGKNLRYSAEARQQQVEGKVFVQFVVRPDGQLSDLKVLKGIGAGCDEEALRVIGQMPAWTPGRQNGQVVAVRYTLPVTFSLPTKK
ncbi:energy transducer TonB [Hymenobacter jeollabukensis]|uniref:Energy transducer TonB n=1 Tax=Hymenobacter jeollabukensis TaxID=2025313 RepID=A0A5R8WT15_9BACT|nr:energy transducer TonB [Hymenobacter jeollabukensis]TLM93947.1 energy transducer TonB [Hymenobacter jeollabukensis]